MAIDPMVLERQRIASTGTEPRKLHLVTGDECDVCGRPIGPLSRKGVCRRCANRFWMRRHRRTKPQEDWAKKGPKMAEDRRCQCGSPIAKTNRTGYCTQCQRNKHARVRRYFTDGGGI